jgi:hypothetical protein
MFYVGLDIHSTPIALCVLSETGQVVWDVPRSSRPGLDSGPLMNVGSTHANHWRSS